MIGKNWLPADRFAFAAFVAMLPLSKYGYDVLPHNAKPVVLILLGAGALSTAVISAVMRMPQSVNLPFPVSDECQQTLAPMNLAFQRFLRAEILVGLLILEFLTIESATKGPLAPLFAIAPLVFLIAVLASVAVFLVRVWRVARG